MKIVIVGAGFGGLATASLLAKEGHKVTLVEKNNYLGGRAKVTKLKGFTFDMGPSWYMMPDLFERYFAHFDKKPTDYYKIIRLKPSYEVVDKNSQIQIYDRPTTKKNFEKIETGSGKKLDEYLNEGKEKYDFAKQFYLFNNYSSIKKLPYSSLPSLISYNPLQSYDTRVNKYFKNETIQHALKFMTVFLGGSPRSISSLYSLLGHADIDLGIWYPIGGFGAVVAGFEKLAQENGVKIIKNFEVSRILSEDGQVTGIVSKSGKEVRAEIVISNADYHHTEQKLLTKPDRYYSNKYWKKLETSPSSILYFIGLDKKIKGLLHHTLFFDSDWNEHFSSIKNHKIITNPLFYVSAPSVTDPSVAPKGKENIFVLVPTPSGIKPTKKDKEAIFNNIIERLEKKFNTSIKDHIIVKKIEDSSYFETEFNSYRGSSFGASHTTRQSSLLRPRLKSKKLEGLYFVGQYTNPGTGVPLVISSAELVNNFIKEDYGNKHRTTNI